MAESDTKSSAWKNWLAAGGLVVSLLGNCTQYQSLKLKRVELAQAEEKLQQSQNELAAAQTRIEQRQQSIDARVNNMRQRLEQLNSQIKSAEEDQQRGAMGLSVYGGRDDGDSKARFNYSEQLIRQGAATEEQLKKQRDALQEKIDAAEAEKAAS